MAERRRAIDAAVGELRERVAGSVLVDEPLARHTTMRVGGPAAALVRAERVEDVQQAGRVAAEHRLPCLPLGRGSNLLVADDGWPGVVVALGRGFRWRRVEGTALQAGGAAPMPGLARAAAGEGLEGLGFGTAIPGTLGGAVRMNAGAHGAQTADVLAWADVVRLDRGGELQRWTVEDLRPRYRATDLPDAAVVVAARLELRRGDPERLQEEEQRLRAWRREHQPVNEPSCGSVFTNPPGDSAGRLIEQAGLKGLRQGGAMVSERHANFITCEPGATAADVRALVDRVRRRVAEAHGVQLSAEVVMVGFDEGRDR